MGLNYVTPISLPRSASAAWKIYQAKGKRDIMPKAMHWKNLHWLWIAFVVIGLDQFSKYLASHYLQFEVPRTIIPNFFNPSRLTKPPQCSGVPTS